MNKDKELKFEKKLKYIIIIFFALIFAISITLVFLLTNKDKKIETKDIYIEKDNYVSSEKDSEEVVNSYKNNIVPEIMDTLYSNYPNYKNTSTFTDDEKTNIINENKTIMDNLVDTIYNGNLKRHPYADYQYNNSNPIDYSVDRVDKVVSINPIITGWRAIGYAMPGEVVTLKFPSNFLNYADIALNIGMSGGTDGETQNLPNTNTFNSKRMPYLTKTISGDIIKSKIQNDEFKIGSPFGGMIYIRTGGNMTSLLPFDVEIKGGVEAPIYIFGETTDEEWDHLRNTPGLMAEIRLTSIRFVMTANFVRNVKNMKDVASFWHKAICLSEYGVLNQSRNLPITIMFDYRVDAGAAVTYVGAWYVQCPTGWAGNAVNYSSIINSGAWGIIHELNHNMQGTYNKEGGWGMSGGTEVTNNVFSSMTYILYTNIASYRTENGGLSGWNYVSDPYYTMKTIYAGSTDSIMLRSYVALAHAFSPQKFLELPRSYYTIWYNEDYATKYSIERGSQSAFCLLASKVFNYDMRYYCSLFNYTIDASVDDAIKNMNLPIFYPIFNLYTDSYNGIKTGRYFEIPGNKTYSFDFGKYMAIDSNLKYSLEVSGFDNGKIEKVSDYIYNYTPNNNATNDSFKLTLILDNGTKIELGGDLKLNYNYSNVKKYNNLTSSNIDKGIEEVKDKSDFESSTTSILGLNNYQDGSTKSLSKVEGNLFFDKLGYYTFFLKADDQGAFYINKGGNNILIAKTTTYTSSYSKTDKNAYSTIYLDKNNFYNFSLYVLNIGGQGNASIGYIYRENINEFDNLDNYSIANITKSNISPLEVNDINIVKSSSFVPDEINFPRPLKNIENSLKNFNADDINVISAPKAISSNNNTKLMFDNDNSTYYHTIYPGNGGATQFPCEFIFENVNKKYFNYFNIYCRRQIDAPGDYEIYVGEDLYNLALIKSGKNTNVNFNVNFDNFINSKYIKINILNNTASYQYIVFAEVSFGIKQDFTNFCKLDENNSKITNMKTSRDANFISTKKLFGSGNVEFNFEGNTFAIYSQKGSQYGKFKIIVDNNEETIVDLYNNNLINHKLVYMFNGENQKHKIKIESVDNSVYNVDLIAFK
jgi:hypothetical protein